MKAAWRREIINLAELNSKETEEVLENFEDMFLGDEELREWDEEVSKLIHNLI